jgi:anti-sigma28 factor (negative regulator of flagellin synthesis)
MFPWLVCLAVFGAGAIALDGVERATAVGAFFASCVGALLAMSQLRRAVSSMRRWMGDRESALSTFADDRAATVARQFQWSVEELVRARAELRRVEGMRVQAEGSAKSIGEKARQDGDELRLVREKLAAMDPSELDVLRAKIEQLQQAFQDEERDRRTAEHRARTAEERVATLTRTLRLVATTVSPAGEQIASRGTSHEVIGLDWTLEYDGNGHTLRLRSTSADVRPNRVRIVDATGRLVVESAGMRQRHPAGLMIRVPPSVAAAVESGNWSAFQLEVEVDGVWDSAVLVDRAEPVVDAEVMQPRSLRIVS